MTVNEQINEFNKEISPFYIVAHDNGDYSLCLAFSFLEDEYADYG